MTKRLYRYWSEKHGLQALQERRVRVSRIMELNDPFEFLSHDLKERDHREALKKLKRQLDKTRGVLCFSEDWRNPVMWAHYADRYKGVCMGFDVAVSGAKDDAVLGKITYVKERLPWPDKLDLHFTNDLLLTKFDHWSYEQEWRGFVDFENCEKDAGHYFTPFSDDLVLKEVYIGLSSSTSPQQVMTALNGLQGVSIKKTRAGFRKFEIVENKLAPRKT